MLFSMWLAASAAAVGVAWAGVSVVDNQVVGPPSVVEFASPSTTAGAQSGAPTTSGSQPTTVPEDVSSSSTTAVDQAPSSAPTTAAPSNTSPTTHTTAQATTTPTSSSTTTPSVQTTLDTPPPAPGSTGPPSTTQTFTLIGGTAAISFSPSRVEVLWATPNPGFGVSIETESPGIKVEFRADHHRSRVDAWWAGGPQHSTHEESEG